MSLSERIKNPPVRPRTGTPCSIAVLLDKLKGAERAALIVMLETPKGGAWPASAIQNALIKEGHAVSYQQINRHRQPVGGCRCPK